MKGEISRPFYISLYESGELGKTAARLNQRLLKCDICPRKCGVNRLQGELGYCKSGAEPIVGSYCSHHGEEPAISGRHGSGTIFFGNCNLSCVFCQNYQISQEPSIQQNNNISIGQLSSIMLKLQAMGCHNINLVSPTHFVPQIIGALNLAAGKGLTLPVVYNSNGYDSLETLSQIDGLISIYLPDIKYSDDELAGRYSQAAGYVQYSRQAIQEMYRQVGGLVLDEDGVAVKGLLVRHLVLPEGIAGSGKSLEWLVENTGNDTGLSLMSQYHPSHLAYLYPEIARFITREEYLGALRMARKAGFEKIFVQQLQSKEIYLPDFNCPNPFGN